MTVSTAPASPKGLRRPADVPSWIHQGAGASLDSHSYRSICIPVGGKVFFFFSFLPPCILVLKEKY